VRSSLCKKNLVVIKTAAYTWDWYCHLVGDRASFSFNLSEQFKNAQLIVFWALKASYKLVKLLPNINSNN
jgi:hypothetical protein